MAINLDQSVSGGNTTGTSLTYSHTCTGSNLLLIVAVTITGATDLVSGITYNGVSMTRYNISSPGAGQNYLYYLLNPATGANNVVVSVSSSTTIYAVSASYTGVRQTGQPDATATPVATDPTASVTQSITTQAVNSWIISGAGQKNTGGSTISAGTGVTSRQINTLVAIGDSNGPINPPGSNSQTWSISPNNGLDIIMASFAPVPTLPTNYALIL